MLYAHERMAELWTISKQRPLKNSEKLEMEICQQANVMYCWDWARIKQLSLMAAATKDVQLQHEICTQLEELQLTGKVSKRT
ncbi:hypothetical protein [Paenibacillus sp. P46E]|uniref:DUF7667 family protein n=1 Tax=Paenibacillus sp. P46E TaxID=1349436 RepID=UPI00093D7538|nr:hypothetical protein [Paenibacillus sp. P46E]OKP96833.1 hypothetical protein A3849_19095 [Paenibacillus sp. P46E]